MLDVRELLTRLWNGRCSASDNLYTEPTQALQANPCRRHDVCIIVNSFKLQRQHLQLKDFLNVNLSHINMYPSTRSFLKIPIQLPVCDFLAPSLIHHSRTPSTSRYLSTNPRNLTFPAQDVDPSHPSAPQQSRTPKSGPEASSNLPPLSKPLSQAQRDFLTSAVSPSPSPPNTRPQLTHPQSSASTKPASSPPH